MLLGQSLLRVDMSSPYRTRNNSVCCGPLTYSCNSPRGCTTKLPGLTGDLAGRRAHQSAAGETEIDLRRVRMQMVRAGLARSPAGNGDIAFADDAEDFLDVTDRVEFLFGAEIECQHDVSSMVRPLVHSRAS